MSQLKSVKNLRMKTNALDSLLRKFYQQETLSQYSTRDQRMSGFLKKI